jgi:uncharacterized protein YcbX
MEISEIWRYPVKSMAGERLAFAELGCRGLTGDRGIAAFDRGSRRPDHPVSARQRPGLLRFGARLEDGQVLVEGPQLEPTPWREPAVEECLSEVCGRRLELTEVEGGAFDDAPVHLVLLPSVAAVAAELGGAVDPRRFRANLFVSANGFRPGAERGWVGSELEIGDVVLPVVAECPRCVITTRDPDGHEPWPALLRHLAATREAMMGVYASVSTPGWVGRTDRLTVISG